MNSYTISYKDKANTRTLTTNSTVVSKLFVKQLNSKKYITEIVVKQQ